jgi:hypothetical protein
VPVVVAAIGLAGVVGGCADDDPPDQPPAPPEVPIPNVVGDKADDAAMRVERAGFGSTFEPEPAGDAELCKVASQFPTGTAEKGSDVTLSLECVVEVPDVTGDPADEAKRRIEAQGNLTASFDFEPEDPSACTVARQDERGTVEPDTEVVLTLTCPLTVEDVRRSATKLAKSSAIGLGGDYEVGECIVESADSGSCEIRYFDRPVGGECIGSIRVERVGDNLNSTQRELECF